MSRPGAGSAARSGYRGGVARKSRSRGGAVSAGAAARRTASAAPADTEQAGTAQAGTAQARTAQAGTAQARTGQAGTAQAGTAQLTAPAATDPDPKHPAYPGERFGLPEQGPGSVANMARRLLALLIDWLLCMVIAYWLTHSQFWTIAVFAIEDYVLTALTGTTVGKRLLGIRVIRTGGGLVGLRWALVRTAILLTVVPPLLTDRDLRGLHDRASDTIVVRM